MQTRLSPSDAPCKQNGQSKINQAIAGLPAKLRLLLTGTPIQNDLSGGRLVIASLLCSDGQCHWARVLLRQGQALQGTLAEQHPPAGCLLVAVPPSMPHILP